MLAEAHAKEKNEMDLIDDDPVEIAKRLLRVEPGQKLHEDLESYIREVDTMVAGGHEFGGRLRSTQVIAAIIVLWQRAEVHRMTVVAA